MSAPDKAAVLDRYGVASGVGHEARAYGIGTDRVLTLDRDRAGLFGWCVAVIRSASS